jgi:excinuclease ABC subunit C
MNSQDLQKLNLPDAPGVYFFIGPKKEILYIGKATSLKDRVRSYFSKDIAKTRGPLIVKMLEEARTVRYTETQSVLEALMLEASQIKKYQPVANVKEKDNKSFNMVIITDEDFPRILVVRSRNLAHWKLSQKEYKVKATYGPFPSSSELREALKIIRKIFPYRDKCVIGGKPCFNAQIGLCPGVCAGWMSKRDYRKQVKRISLFFEGKKDTLTKDIEKDMKAAAKEQKFEEAEKLKRMLYALEHIQDIALIKRDNSRVYNENIFRIEAYDIAHLQGKETVGVMVVVEDGELNKSQYRKFKIRGKNNKVGINDIANLSEILERRLHHAEWTLPNLIVVDGGIAQINAAEKILKEKNIDIKVVSVVKDAHHKAREILGKSSKEHERDVLLANSEAHRFAIGYHRKLRRTGFRI